MPTTTAKQTLAERFPHTAKQIRDEILEAERRLAELVDAKVLFDRPGEDYQIEVVVPCSDPSHHQGKGFGKDVKKCLEMAQRRAGRRGLACAFVNLKDNLSIAIESDDLEGDYFSSQRVPMTKPCITVVWTRDDRGSIWLL